MKNLEKMLTQKSSKGEMSPEAIQAKMDVLKELMESCKAKLGDNVKSGMDEMQKVTVAAPDKEALALGLDKAKELTQSQPSMLDSLEELSETSNEEESENKESLESPEEEEEDISMFAKKRK
jgi:hypothetical protein